MMDLGLLKKFFGIHFYQTEYSLLLHQMDYAISIIEDYALFNSESTLVAILNIVMLSCKIGTSSANIHDYQSLIKKLHYLSKTKFDIGFVILLLSHYMHTPQQAHLDAAQGMVNYFQKFPYLDLWFSKGENNQLVGFLDIDYASDMDNRISIEPYIFKLGNTSIS